MTPDVLFMVGCQGVHGSVNEPSVIQIGPNPVLMGRHYPLDVAAQCDVRDTLRALTEALKRRPGAEAWARQRAKVRAYARTLIDREEKLVRDHSHDAIVHPAVLEAQLAEMLEAPVFASRQIFVNFPNRHPLYCAMYPVSKDFEKTTGLRPDVLFMVGCQGVHGGVNEPSVLQIGPNPVLMGRHYPLDVAVQCDVRDTLRALTEALMRHGGREGWVRQRARVRAYARTLIEREEKLVRDHSDDAILHPAVLEAQLAAMLPREAVMVQESSTARTALIPFGHDGMTWTRSGGGSLGWGVGAAIGAKIAVGHARPVVLHLGDGALTYSASGFWTMARYRTPILTIVSNNETYQIVRHNWANQMPDSKMVRDGKYPGLFLGDPATDYVGLARSQGVDGEAVTTVKDLEPALRRGLDIVTGKRRPYLLDVTVAREGVGADATWYDDWEM